MGREPSKAVRAKTRIRIGAFRARGGFVGFVGWEYQAPWLMGLNEWIPTEITDETAYIHIGY
jgi:hypothetical protein